MRGGGAGACGGLEESGQSSSTGVSGLLSAGVNGPFDKASGEQGHSVKVTLALSVILHTLWRAGARVELSALCLGLLLLEADRQEKLLEEL